MDGSDPVDAAIEQLAAADVDVMPALAAWRERGGELWQRDPRLHRGFADAMIRAGHPTQAFELAREGLAAHPGDPMLTYLAAQALVRGHNPERARDHLRPLLDDTAGDPVLHARAQGLAGRIEKDMCARAADRRSRRAHAAAAARAYRAALTPRPWYFPAINAATMSRVAGDRRAATELAHLAVDLAGAELARGGGDGAYWLHATLGEARLLLGDGDGAAAAYAEAVRLAGKRYGDVASMRSNVRLLEPEVEVPEAVLRSLDVGAVVVFSGHMIDQPDRRATPRFPPDAELERRVAAAIAAELDTARAVVGYASAACGSDILFGEAMLARGAELHLVLPFGRDDFYRTSVDFGADAMRGWRLRCDDLLARASEVHYATREPYLGTDALFGFADSVSRGLAINRAAQLGVEPIALVVRDPAGPVLPAGTAAFARTWVDQGRPLRAIDLSALRRDPRPRPPRRRAARRPPRPRGRRQIKAMLFADVKNFSKLPEERAPRFFLTFLAEVQRTIRRARRAPVFQNTWGDGLYLVFDDVVDCADFALGLLDRLAAVDWEAVGLPDDTAVRMGVHAGPVYRGRDPIIGRDNFFGSHVTRAARIEPVTTPGCAFASEQFAAALAAVAGHDFACDYVGIQPLAKEAGSCVLYRLRRQPRG